MTTIDLRPAADRMAGLIAGIDAGALDAPTPCPGLDVGGLLDHVATFCDVFTKVAGNEPAARAAEPAADNLPEDWASEIPVRLGRLADAWSVPEAWEGDRQVAGLDLPAPVAGLVALDELVVHGWDVAVATGQPYEARAEDIEAAAGFVRSFDAPRDGALFGPEVAVPADAPPLHRLLGLTGRDPAWRPS